ncbi:MAG: hypothetical protein AB7S48_09185 [Bacteroidales bacterium]
MRWLFTTYRLTVSLILLLIVVSCDDKATSLQETNDEIVITSEIITETYAGNGVQWGGYDILTEWIGTPSLSNEDWDKLFKRVTFMRPPLVRIMVSDGWNYMINGEYNPAKSNDILIKILDFCQAQNITVIIGEWGHKGDNSIDEQWLDNSVNFLDYLIVTKNYTCIKYFNMVNEPNGSWSSIDGNFMLWKSLIEQFHDKLITKNIDSKIKIIGPDVAVWSTNLISWITNTNYELGDKVGAYDIHTYPTETEVRTGTYFEMIKSYQNEVPNAKEMFMCEFGFKYSTLSELGIENALRKANDKYASDDSNMMIYDSFYGIDVVDAIMQNMLAGYSGIILWNLDDAMYNSDGSNSTKLKRWGFWNILGSEKFENASDENIRPWFYPASLMSRYFPAGSSIINVTLPDKKGLRAVVGTKDGRYSIAIVNSNFVKYTIDLKATNELVMTSVKVYQYIAGEDSNFTGATDNDGFAVPSLTDDSINLSPTIAKTLSLPPQSFFLFTNMD